MSLLDKINFSERMEHAFSQDVRERAGFLGRSSLFASFIRIPTFMMINSFLFKVVGDRKDDKGQNVTSNFLLATIQNFAIPLTLWGGAFISEFFNVDLEQPNRAAAQADDVARSVDAIRQTLPVEPIAVDKSLLESVSAETYVSQYSYIHRVMNGEYDAASVSKTLAFVSSLIRTCAEQARIEGVESPKGTMIMDSKALEVLAKELKGVTSTKTITEGQVVDGESQSVSGLDEIGMMARDMLSHVSEHLPLKTSQEIMRAEQMIAI